MIQRISMVLFLLATPFLFGQAAPAPPAGMQHPAGMPDHAAMMQKMADMDARLQSLVAAMNSATGTEKVNRMADVINELVAQQTAMHAEMKRQMESGMGEHHGMAPNMMGKPMDGSGGHMNHHAAMMERGATGMGFSQEKTTHHFTLLQNGGTIQVTANDTNDTQSVAAIREHLAHIASAFSKGDFDLPMFIHDQTPPGVNDMKPLQKSISYRYEEIASGGRVVIHATTPAAVSAVHDFLKFQISDHQTGDPVTVQR